jgi:hypothetical protein
MLPPETQLFPCSLSVSDEAILKSPGFFPTLKQLFTLSAEFISRIYLIRVLYNDLWGDDIKCLTFKFSNNTDSPVTNTYPTEPHRWKDIPPPYTYSEMTFKTYK